MGGTGDRERSYDEAAGISQDEEEKERKRSLRGFFLGQHRPRWRERERERKRERERERESRFIPYPPGRKKGEMGLGLRRPREEEKQTSCLSALPSPLVHTVYWVQFHGVSVFLTMMYCSALSSYYCYTNLHNGINYMSSFLFYGVWTFCIFEGL